jgi:formate--tetrahydrofolate ligase
MRSIDSIADDAGFAPGRIEPRGRFVAKVRLDPSDDARPRGRLVAVTAVNPTPHGEGKTVTAIGLVDALRRLGTRALATLRQPSLGPIFGVKGGATGSGRAQIVPADVINLHFTGDFHAVAAAQNLLAALTDNHVYHGNALGIAEVRCNRAVDVDDRMLRHVVLGTGSATSRAGAFDVVAACEVMAALSLASDLGDLERRLARMLVATRVDGSFVTAADVRAHGAMTALLRDAVAPNLVQTLEGSPVLVHTGPFANVASGNSSVLADRVALAHADVVVTEAGFGSDCGFEKLVDLKCRDAGYGPELAVVVVSARSMAWHGGGSVRAGCENLAKHVENVRAFGVPCVVAVNVFAGDAEADLAAIEDAARAMSTVAARSAVHDRGGEGGEALARAVLATLGAGAPATPIYDLDHGLREKIERVATRVYGAASVTFSDEAARRLDAFEAGGYARLPVCIAKTPASLSHDPELLNRPRDFVFPVEEARLFAGAGYVLALAGKILTMPGLPERPRAESIDVDASGSVIGLD